MPLPRWAREPVACPHLQPHTEPWASGPHTPQPGAEPCGVTRSPARPSSVVSRASSYWDHWSRAGLGLRGEHLPGMGGARVQPSKYKSETAQRQRLASPAGVSPGPRLFLQKQEEGGLRGGGRSRQEETGRAVEGSSTARAPWDVQLCAWCHSQRGQRWSAAPEARGMAAPTHRL